jgi:hypothetical protein
LGAVRVQADVVVGGERFAAMEGSPFVFGRANADAVTGLDPKDMGISAEAGSIEFHAGLWWITNRSRKRPILIEQAPGSSAVRLDAGERMPLTRTLTIVLVPGAIYTHRLEVRIPEDSISSLQVTSSPASGTITLGEVVLSDKDRDALAALLSGYLRSYPSRDPHPLSYQEAADLLGSPWNKVTIRKQIERLKERLARSGLYFQGPRANEDLADHLIANGFINSSDLSRLDFTGG